jgi:hypothetical protein
VERVSESAAVAVFTNLTIRIIRNKLVVVSSHCFKPQIEAWKDSSYWECGDCLTCFAPSEVNERQATGSIVEREQNIVAITPTGNNG